MISAKLKAVATSNFAPFANTINFTTQIDKNKREYITNTFVAGDDSLNKVSFVFGANGSGKTFFCKIIKEIQRLLLWSPLTLGSGSQLLQLPMFKGIDASIQKFLFDTAYVETPTTFSIDIVLDKTTYHYEFSIQGYKVLHELLTKKYRRTEILLERTSPNHKDILLKSELKNFESHKHTVKEEALCLAIAHTLNNPMAVNIVDAINNINVLNMVYPYMKAPDHRISFSEERVAKYAKVLAKATPMLRGIAIAVSEEDFNQPLELGDFENREVMMTKTTLSINSEYTRYNNGQEESFQALNFFRDESLGTVKLFTMLPYLYDTLENGGVLILDEIENGLHLSLAKDVVKLFLDEESNPNNAQLICTTHQPLLIDTNTRRDQVWVISKDSIGKSSLNRLSELSTSRSKVNLTNKILENAFGCNPEPFFRN